MKFQTSENVFSDFPSDQAGAVLGKADAKAIVTGTLGLPTMTLADHVAYELLDRFGLAEGSEECEFMAHYLNAIFSALKKVSNDSANISVDQIAQAHLDKRPDKYLVKDAYLDVTTEGHLAYMLVMAQQGSKDAKDFIKKIFKRMNLDESFYSRANSEALTGDDIDLLVDDISEAVGNLNLIVLYPEIRKWQNFRQAEQLNKTESC